METKAKPRSRKRISINMVNLFLDLGVAVAFVADMELRFTGLRNHELIGLALGALLLIHIVLHWRWILSVTVRFFRKMFHESRLNYVLNAALLIDMAVLIITGIGISRTLGLSLGIDRQTQQSWHSLHTLTSHLSLILVGAHVGLHWKWILTNAKKYLITMPLRRLKPRKLQPAPARIAVQPRIDQQINVTK